MKVYKDNIEDIKLDSGIYEDRIIENYKNEKYFGVYSYSNYYCDDVEIVFIDKEDYNELYFENISIYDYETYNIVKDGSIYSTCFDLKRGKYFIEYKDFRFYSKKEFSVVNITGDNEKIYLIRRGG